LTKILKLGGENNITEDFINMIKDNEIIIYEDVQGSKICVKHDGNKFIIKPKSVKSDELNFIDLTVQNFYNDAYRFFNNLPQHVIDLINPEWWFIFEYFPDNQPANIEYSRKPKNNLILTCIVKKNKYIYNIEEIIEYSTLFEVDHLPIFFKGILDDKQIEIIYLFLNTSEKDLKYIFNETNFAKFFYDIINPDITKSFLMNDNNFNDNLEKIIIKLNDNDEFSFELLNPLYKKISLDNNTEYVEIYTLILVNFMEFFQLIELDKIKVKGLTNDELYINMICKLFNMYMKNTKHDYELWNFQIPLFFKEEKFKINIDLLQDKETVNLIKVNEKFEYIFKVILGSFNKKRKKPIGIFNEKTVELFNNVVDSISRHINKILDINVEYKLQKKDLLNFEDFFGFNFSKDSNDDLYINTFDEIERKNMDNKKVKYGDDKYNIKMKKENMDYNYTMYDIAERIFNKLGMNNILYEIDLNKFINSDYIVLKLTESKKEAMRCNYIKTLTMKYCVNIFDVFVIKSNHVDKELYCIIMDDYSKKDLETSKLLVQCVNDIGNDKKEINEDDICYKLFLRIKYIHDELDEKNIKIKDFMTTDYGLKNGEIVFVDYENVDSNILSIEKELVI
jgi:hypothetical protein